MRLVTLAFPSAAAFLTSYDDGVVTVATRTDAVLGEEILVEISFPGLPNRALMRATVDGLLIDEEGLRVKVSQEDTTTCDFMLKIAKGELKMSAHREHKRFPASLEVRYTTDAAATAASVGSVTRGDAAATAASVGSVTRGDAAATAASVGSVTRGDAAPAEHKGVVDDLGAGGTFVLTQTPAPVGTKVALTIEVPGGKDVKASGVVAWVKTGPGANAGFGVDFDPLDGDDGRRLRALLRKASETAEVDLDKRDK